MKLGDKKTHEYARDGVVSHGRLRIANNTTMQQILSDFLYSDKVTSCLREICTNAWEANKQKAFKITLPTYTDQNPQVVIRDYGPGLNKEELEEIYTVYGVSTKRDSNDEVGAFGLGSKSPLCLKDYFTVISYNNGTKYVVSVSKDSRGAYCFDIMSETSTTEPSGLEVIIDVGKNQITEFCQKAEKVLRWFPIAPICNIKLNLTKPKIQESGDGWDITNYSAYYDEKNVVLMGPVAYPIDSSHFKGIAKIVLDNCHLIVKVGIGEVSIAPSRESLQYTPDTINKISSILENLHSTVEQKVKDQVKNCKSLWEARLLGMKYLNANDFTNRILGGKITYNGQSIDARSSYFRLSGTDPKFIKYEWNSRENRTYERKKGNSSIEIHERTKFALYTQGGYARARRYVEQNPNITLLVFDSSHKQFLIDTVGLLESDILYTCNFPQAVRQAKAKSVGNKIQAYRYDPTNRYSYWERNFWNHAEIDIDAESGYYCPILKFEVVHNGRSSHPNHITTYANGYNIIGVLANRVHKVENHKNWKHIRELFKDNLDKIASTKIYEITSRHPRITRLMELKPLLKKKDTELYKIITLAESVTKHQDTIAQFENLNKVYNRMSDVEYKLKTTIEKVDLDIDLESKYPLLEYIDSSYWKKHAVIDYINSIDQL